MALVSRWSGRGEAELIGRVRMLCYGAGMLDLPKFVESVSTDARARDGEFLVVERDGRAVGTATSHHLTLHTHGAGFACQGVAYVGTIRTERRRSAAEGPKGAVKESGVATVVMRETLKRGRDRGDVVSALMPFRASYYEHFGYGLVERQAQWTIPMGVIAAGDSGAFKPFEDRMLPEMAELRNAIARRGNCDIERPVEHWRLIFKRNEAGFVFVDEPAVGDIRGWAILMHEPDGLVRVADWGVKSAGDFSRLLSMLGSLKDQYAKVQILTPTDLPVNRLLKETQVPHRPVVHPTAQQGVFTRMQIRVLDHVRFLEAIRWPMDAEGELVVSIRECEGHETRLKLTVSAGRCEARPTENSATFATSDKNWATVVSGEMSATEAVRWGLAEGVGELLDGLARGRKPFTHEAF